ncbi:phosphomannomutase/phosphoglucomutase [Candidatus Dojkabacteria bacterium]|nr:phosphomannomutase/phosphoglucomutase [Candidatus Dojkabacteria bacterium]
MSTITKQQLDSVFHAYDVRGRDPEELNEEFFETLGKAFVTYLDAKKIVVGNDIRKSSELYKKAFTKGATSVGCDVIDIEEIATEMLYYTTGKYKDEFDGGATVTASHNPPGWNGCKMVSKSASALSSDKGLDEIKELMLTGDFRESDKQGEVNKKDVYPEFKEKVLSFLEGNEIKPLKIVVDAGNGIGGKMFDYVFGDLPLEVIKMYFEPDGDFPNHTPNPIEIENVIEIMDKTNELQADIGIAIDGDADRTFFVDNKKRNPDGIYTGSIFIKHFLEKYPGGKIVMDPRVTGPIIEELEKYGGEAVMSKAGHSFYKSKMKETGAVFGLENSSHFFFKDFYYADSGMIIIAIMLKLLSEGLDFDERLDYLFKKFPKSGEVNYEVENTKDTIAKVEEYVKENYPDAEFDYIDGIAVELDSWRFSLRPSNTQPLLRLNLESHDKQTVVERFKEIEKIIGGKRNNLPPMEELRNELTK